ncbi:MAG: DUF4252 domain-containing protein [Bacteroidia bacterium]|nr:DUF4252 domain-containing protein [Bacteroidia bacterium]
MKKAILSILLLMSFSLAFAQKNPFEKFSDMDGVTSVYISKTMLSMIPKNSKMDYGGVNVGGFLNKLSSILILTSEDQKIAPQMLSLANNRVKGSDYELLMRVKSDDNDNINFFMKGKPEDIRELIMIVAGNDGENVVMQFLGNFTLKDIQQMTEGFNK